MEVAVARSYSSTCRCNRCFQSRTPIGPLRTPSCNKRHKGRSRRGTLRLGCHIRPSSRHRHSAWDLAVAATPVAAVAEQGAMERLVGAVVSPEVVAWAPD